MCVNIGIGDYEKEIKEIMKILRNVPVGDRYMVVSEAIRRLKLEEEGGIL